MEKQTTWKVILVDDHTLLRDALANLLNESDEFTVTGSAHNGLALFELLKNGLETDLIILDLNMEGMDGFDTARKLAIDYPDIKVLVLTMYDSDVTLIRLLQSGVRGFMKKDIHPGDLKRALISVAEGGFYYAHQATGKLANFFQQAHNRQISVDRAMLSESEMEFLRLASTDKTYKEIASDLSISPRAVDGLRDGLFEKLDVKSRVGLAIYAVRNGIVKI